jgi:sugar (glycoside-pentoside-hexuronide) transporter
MEKQTFQTKRRERAGFYSYFVGQNIIYFLVTMFLGAYYINNLGIPAAAVGSILLVARIWDAVNDPMLSILVEKANLKGGKFKPWIKSVAFLIPILTVLLFSFTDVLAGMSLSLRITYATVTYIAWGMTYTISDAPAFALATVMTSDMNEKNTIISLARMAAMVGVLISIGVGPAVIEATGNNWMLAAGLLSVIALIFMVQVNFTKERVSSSQHSPTLKHIVNAIIGNKYVVIYVLVATIMSGFNFGLSITPMLAGDVFNNPLATTAIMMSSFLPILLLAPFLPALIRKFGKINIFRTTMVLQVVLSIITYFVGYESITVFVVLSFIKGFSFAPIMVIGSLFFADAIEYDYYTKGKRFEAAVFSAQTFSAKATSAISGGLGLALLGFVGYQESLAGEVIVQSQSTIDGIWTIFNLGPAFGALIAIIIFWMKYDLSEEKLQALAGKANK